MPRFNLVNVRPASSLAKSGLQRESEREREKTRTGGGWWPPTNERRVIEKDPKRTRPAAARRERELGGRARAFAAGQRGECTKSERPHASLASRPAGRLASVAMAQLFGCARAFCGLASWRTAGWPVECVSAAKLAGGHLRPQRRRRAPDAARPPGRLAAQTYQVCCRCSLTCSPINKTTGGGRAGGRMKRRTSRGGQLGKNLIHSPGRNKFERRAARKLSLERAQVYRFLRSIGRPD